MNGRVTHVNLARGFRGGERQTELLIKGLAERGLAQRLVAREGGPLALKLHDVPGLEIRDTRGLVSAAWRCGGDCTVVHAHEGRAVHAAHLRNLFRGTPYIVTRRVTKRPTASPLTRRAYRRAARVVAISRSIAAILCEYEPALALEIVPDAIAHLPTFASSLARLRERYRDCFVIGHVGALDRRKGQSIIVEVARRLQRTYPDIRFVLVGSGRDEGRLRGQADGLRNVAFTGFVEDVGNYLSVFDLFVFPSNVEGLGSAVLDAMDYGLPVIATRVGGLPELVRHEENGLLIEPDNADQLEFAILTLYHDPERRAAMAERAREFSQAFTPARMVDRYLEIYRKVQTRRAA